MTDDNYDADVVPTQDTADLLEGEGGGGGGMEIQEPFHAGTATLVKGLTIPYVYHIKS